jgi:chromosome segregation ATPase
LRLSEIKEFKFQTRPYEWVEFKNVSLKPGVRTEVEVVVAAAAGRERLEKVNLKDVEVKNILAKLGEWTGKTIIAESDVLNQKITVYSADELTRSDALSAIFAALGQRGIVTEKKGDIIVLKRLEDEDLGAVAAAFAKQNRADETTRKEMAARERAKIADKLAALESHQVRLQRDLGVAEKSMEEVRTRWGISDLEERSYPHPITSRLSRLQEQRDDCIVEASRLEARIEILHKKVKAADAEQKEHGFKVTLEKARDELILLRSKLERLQTMVDEAEAQKKDLDAARAQYGQRLAVRDERREMLDTIREQIEKLRIVHDDPQLTAAPIAPAEVPAKGEAARRERRLSREEIRAKLASLENQRNRMQQDLDVVERSLEDVRARWGFSDLEERSYPHPVTARVMRLEQERDACLVEIAQLRAEVNNLEEQAETADGKANLKRAQDDLVVLQEKYEQLQKMCDEAVAKEKDLDTARVQYKQRASVRDERKRMLDSWKRMLDSLKEQIEKLRILHDDPATPEVRE